MSFTLGKLFFGEISGLLGRLGKYDAEEVLKTPFRDELGIEEAKLSFAGLFPFLRSAFVAFPREIATILALSTAAVLATLAQPYLISTLLERISETRTDNQLISAMGAALFFFAAGMIQVFSRQHSLQQQTRFGQKLLDVARFRVFELAIRNPGVKLSQSEALNAHSRASSLSLVGILIAELYSIILTSTVGVFLVFHIMGPAASIVLLALVVFLFFILFVSPRLAIKQSSLMGASDGRAKLLLEALQNIRLVKYNNLSDVIVSELDSLRTVEVRHNVSSLRIQTYSQVFFVAFLLVLVAASLGAYAWLGNTLTVPIAFSCIALFLPLFGAVKELPYNISALTNLKVRIDKLREDLQNLQPAASPASTPTKESCIMECRDVSIAFDAAPVLSRVSFAIEEGQSVAIVGRVGCGKSVLLRALAGELAPRSGYVAWRGGTPPPISLVQQSPFLFNGSIAENIEFYGERIKDRESLLRFTALDTDLKALEAGIFSEVGERGTTLSGGQKQRIALARACHHDGPVVVLDDTFSALDSRTEDFIFQNLLFGNWNGKTRIVTTHKLKFLPKFDKVIFIDGGTIAAQGTFAELWNGNREFKEYCSHDRALTQLLEPATQEAACATSDGATSGEQKTLPKPDKEVAPNQSSAGRITDDDLGGGKGHRGWKVYFNFLLGFDVEPWKGALILLTFLSLTSLTVVAPIAQQFVMGVALSQARPSWVSTLQGFLGGHAAAPAIAIYVAFGTGIVLFENTRIVTWFHMMTRTGLRIHSRALKGIFGTSIRFFDANPSGRLLHRYSSELAAIDGNVAFGVEKVIVLSLGIAISLVTLASTLPWMLLVIVPTLAAMARFQNIYRKNSAALRRISSIRLARFNSWLSESLDGASSFRSYRRVEEVLRRYKEELRDVKTISHAVSLMNRRFALQAALLGGIIGGSVAVFLVLAAHGGFVGVAVAGVALSLSLRLEEGFIWIFRYVATLEGSIIPLERFHDDMDLPPEEAPSSNHGLVPEKWPSHGLIEARKISVRYASHLPEVLHDLSACFKPGVLNVIVGRTGSGKSTLIQALMRAMPLESGSILIDGQDISKIPLWLLRDSIAFVPQDPVLFSWTLRRNLDLRRHLTTERILDTLQRLGLESLVASQPQGLDTVLTNAGKCLSVGQRQLLCLARAVLEDRQIIILDEPTSSIDKQTDRLVLDLLELLSQRKTIIVIAHREETIRRAGNVVDPQASVNPFGGIPV